MRKTLTGGLSLIVAAFSITIFFNAAPLMAGEYLSEGDVRRVVETLQELKPVWDQEEEQMGAVDEMDELADPEDMDSMDQDFGFSAEDLRFMRENAAIRGVLDRHGFTPETWAPAAQKVIKAFVSVKMEESQGEMRREMEEGLAELKNDPNLSPEQKQQIEAQMQAAMASVAHAFNAPEQDKKAVAPYSVQLADVLDWEDDEFSE